MMTKSRPSLEIDYNMLKRLEFLDPKGEAGLMKNLVTLYIESTPDSMKKLRAAAGGPKPQLSKVAHSVKSGHSNLGVKGIVQILQRIEDQKFEDSELTSLLDQVEEMSVAAGDELKQYLENGLKKP